MIFRGMSLADIVIFIPVVLLALTVHEFSHGFVSYKLGDPTPKYEGRLTLNPLAHLDPLGTLLMVITGFGWARPVGINVSYYKNRKVGTVITSLAGPFANFLLALISFVLFYAVYLIMSIRGGNMLTGLAAKFFSMSLTANITLMVFNLIPIPPLDGSRVLDLFLSDEASYKLHMLERYSMIVIMILSLTGILGKIVSVGTSIVFNILNTMVGSVFGLFF